MRGEEKRKINYIQRACSNWREGMRIGDTYKIFILTQYCEISFFKESHFSTFYLSILVINKVMLEGIFKLNDL